MKKDNFNLYKCDTYPLGAFFTDRGIRFSFLAEPGKACGVLIYTETSTAPQRIEFPDWTRSGFVCSAEVEFPDCKGCIRYLLFCGEEVFPDPCMRDSSGFGSFGTAGSPMSVVIHDTYEHVTEGVSVPLYSSIYYMLNVRSYTAHTSSRVKDRGTFRGLMSKIPYIKKLGITSVILMPVYEFNEITGCKNPALDKEGVSAGVNLWGYTTGYYFVPKYAFSASGHPVEEMQELVDSMHKAGLEVILQFWFPNDFNTRHVTDILRFWHIKYGVDGFQIIGSDRFAEDIMTDPVLYGLKFLWDRPVSGNSATYNVNHGYLDLGFMTEIRKFLKGDPNSAYNAAMYMRNADPKTNPVNFIARQDTMRAYDIVSYNEKHNEENGENGRDGADYNYSWNCGIEGPTRRKNITELRTRQFMNAFAMTILGQGAPLIYGGDEFGNTQFGNNNPYNQDNATGYVKWPGGAYGRKLEAFVADLIAVRRKHPGLGSGKALTGRDYLSYGFPDVSMHGEELWRSDLGPTSHSFGLLYYDRYFDSEKDTLVFILLNMHWEDRKLALPKLKNGKKWSVRLTSDKENRVEDSLTMDIKQRSFAVLEAEAR